ncbi:TPA: SET domain-containing protein [Candidatus Woesearchaeota archaeon]|nr:SET domain-containing protein [Candidatus Woesearchaeota archaeon]
MELHNCQQLTVAKTVSAPLFEVRRSSIHGNGVFAATSIPKGTMIIEYVGEKLTKAESDRRIEEWESKRGPDDGEVYIFELDDEYDIDGNVPENDAKFVNHSCDPNCEYYYVDGHIWYRAKKDIRPGEELSINYGFDLDDFEDYPCRCGSPNCVGYIVDEEDWPAMKEILRKKAACKDAQATKPEEAKTI